MPAAATLGHFHTCPRVNPGTPPVPHVGGPITMGAPTVLINGMPAARVGDMAVCIGPPDKIAKGSKTVIINGKPAARMGDRTAHGGVIVTGSPNVLIGDSFSGGGGGFGAGGGASGSTGAASSAAGATLAAGALGIAKANGGSVSPQSGHTASPAAPSASNLVDKAVGNSNSKVHKNAVSEVIGELGMEEYKQKSGTQDDPRFIKRYHGPDDLAKDANGKTVGLEAKGTATGSTEVNQNQGGVSQLSREANLKRANKMLGKKRKGKVGKQSGRIGGPYTEEEMDLYQEIKDNGGKKKLVSTHTHTDTGEVTVVERDAKGNPVKKDKFHIDDFDNKKSKILKLLRHLL